MRLEPIIHKDRPHVDSVYNKEGGNKLVSRFRFPFDYKKFHSNFSNDVLFHFPPLNRSIIGHIYTIGYMHVKREWTGYIQVKCH